MRPWIRSFAGRFRDGPIAKAKYGDPERIESLHEAPDIAQGLKGLFDPCPSKCRPTMNTLTLLLAVALYLFSSSPSTEDCTYTVRYFPVRGRAEVGDSADPGRQLLTASSGLSINPHVRRGNF